ncbi:uncharacterized protein LOC121731962 [Aricia agestis]|uniref:uncharacterized protein LOC121731962 n=1 Tax=Aricia agestis TaxID=91739 RepID=UPI001C20A13D|nr:uncharacterized protein LOC121731962 [Aricia agestis]
MEADSTTQENCLKDSDDISLPFTCDAGDLALYKEFVKDKGKRNYEMQLVEKLQSLGLIPSQIPCPTNGENCNVVCKPARVIDRMQWVCEGCSKRQPIRTGSFFFKLQCSLLQALQVILAWCEDSELEPAAQYFDVKLRVANQIYDKLDELAIEELRKTKLGGEGAVVLTEMYPDCLNRLSPDTTDAPNMLQVLMIADTKHIPTHYRLHVITSNLKKTNSEQAYQALKAEIEGVLAETTIPNSMLVSGTHLPPVDGTVPLQHLLQQCDADMQHFLSSRIWRQAARVCGAARAGGGAAQRYVDAALHRLRHTPHYFVELLPILAARGRC